MPAWNGEKTEETEMIEALLQAHFPDTKAYRFNSASIRVRVIDEQFERKSIAEREAMVLPLIDGLPEQTRDDILFLLTLARSEVGTFIEML